MGLAPSAIMFLVLAAGCCAASSYLIFRETEDVNRKLPPEEQIEYAWMYPGKMLRIRKAYQRFYPGGPLDRWRRILAIAGVVFIALTAVLSGFLR